MTFRESAIAAYGGKCGWCGRADQLELDHIHNDGAAHRRALGRMRIEEWLQQEGYPTNVVQLLCRVCHEIKMYGRIGLSTQLKSRIKENVSMPPRDGAKSIHVSLDEEALDLLERQTKRPPYQNRSEIIETLIKGRTGHETAMLTGLVQQLQTLTATLPDELKPLSQMNGQLANMTVEVAHLKRQYQQVLDVLKVTYDSIKAMEQRQQESSWLHWWKTLFGVAPRKRLNTQDIRR